MSKKIIKDSENFRIAYNAAIRMFCRNHDPELLDVLEDIYARYLRYFDLRTISVALRDLKEVVGYGDFVSPYPLDMNREPVIYQAVLPFLSSMLRFQTCKEQETGTSGEWRINEAALPNDVRNVRDSRFLYGNFPHLCEDGDVLLDVDDNRTLDVLAWNITAYSCGRHTYMPGVATEFVLDNHKQISSGVLEKILDYLEKIPKYDDEAKAAACDDYMQNLRWKLVKKDV